MAEILPGMTVRVQTKHSISNAYQVGDLLWVTATPNDSIQVAAVTASGRQIIIWRSEIVPYWEQTSAPSAAHDLKDILDGTTFTRPDGRRCIIGENDTAAFQDTQGIWQIARDVLWETVGE